MYQVTITKSMQISRGCGKSRVCNTKPAFSIFIYIHFIKNVIIKKCSKLFWLLACVALRL